MLIKKRILLTSVLILNGCVTPGEIPLKVDPAIIKPMTFDYEIKGVDKDTLFVRGRDHFATIYSDSRSVIRVQDPIDGVILGKGYVDWKIMTGSSVVPFVQCDAQYNVRFIAKEGKARLQLELINGVSAYSKCPGWPLPSVSGYEEIKTEFKEISNSFDSSLKGGGTLSSFKNF